MEARAIARSVGMSPRKMRMVVDLIRGRGVNEAYSILKFSKKAATTPVEKTLRSAVANATQKAEAAGSFLDVDDLVVREVYVDEGRTLKRPPTLRSVVRRTSTRPMPTRRTTWCRYRFTFASLPR